RSPMQVHIHLNMLMLPIRQILTVSLRMSPISSKLSIRLLFQATIRYCSQQTILISKLMVQI
ncbi:hypothetical protein CGH51_25725, partial [Vibrio parahaemolyticus]